MNQEWQQTNFILESCPINGYRISLIPSKIKNIINSRSNIYSKTEEPKLFPNEKTLNNNGFYLSNFGKLKPKVTIKNASNINNNNFKINNRDNYINRNILNNNKSEDYYYYNRNKGRQILGKRIIKIFNNDMPFIMRTEPEEDSENIYKFNKTKNYYLTPNYYNNQDDDDDSYLDNTNDYMIRNINYPVIYKFNDNANIKHSRKNIDNDNLLSKRRIKNPYKYKKYIETENKDIRRIKENKHKIFSNLNNNIYNRYKKIEPIRANKRYINQGKKYSLINKKLNPKGERKVKNNSKEMNNTVSVTTTNLNNHTFFISNNKEKNPNTIVKITPSQKNFNINKYTLENLQNEKSLNNKTSYYKERKSTYNENDNINKNDYYIKLKRRELNENEIPKRKNGKIEHYIDKYYDKQGNFIGTKNIIIKKKYGYNGEKIVREIIREEISSDYKNLFKKDKYIQETQKQNIEKENSSNKDLINKNDNIYNIVEEEKNRFTFENKSNVLKFELEDKEEKEADEQKILVDSEFEDEEKDKAEKEKENNKEINNNIGEQNIKENKDKEVNNENNEIKEDNIKNNDDESKEHNNEDNKEKINNLKDELLIESKINNEMNNNEENHINN